MKGLLITILVLVILGMLKVGVRVLYQQKKVRLEVLISKFKIVLLGKDEKPKKAKVPKVKKDQPAKPKKEKKTKSNLKSKSVQPSASQTGEKKPKKKGKFKPWIDAALAYWQEILQLIGRVLTSPTLDDLQLEIRVGGGDAEKCAMTYGKICAIVGGVLPVVENTFGIRKRRIEVYPCFDRDDLDIMADVSITLRIYEIFALVFALLGLGLKIFLEARKNKKGGAAV